MGLTVLRTPVRAPQANAFCERLAGTIRRECLDFMIPLNERHLRRILQLCVSGISDGFFNYQSRITIAAARTAAWDGASGSSARSTGKASNGHQLPSGASVVATPILGGLQPDPYRRRRQGL
jgi:putative transposase